MEERECNIRKGIAWILLSAFGFALMGMFVRAAGDIPFVQKTLFRNLIAFIIAFTTLCAKGFRDKSVFHVPRGAVKFLWLRSAIGCLGIFGNFYAIGRMNISDAAMLNKMSPFFALVASALILGERPSAFSVATLCTAFFGSLFVLKPSFDFQKFFPAIVGFIGGAGAGFAAAFVRKLHSYKVNGLLIISFFSAFSCLLAVPYMIFNYTPMSDKQLAFLLLAGCSASLGQFGLTGAYFNAPASKISVYDYSNVIFAALLGFAAFGQVPDALSVTGYFIIISSAVAVFVYNAKVMH